MKRLKFVDCCPGCCGHRFLAVTDIWIRTDHHVSGSGLECEERPRAGSEIDGTAVIVYKQTGQREQEPAEEDQKGKIRQLLYRTGKWKSQKGMIRHLLCRTDNLKGKEGKMRHFPVQHWKLENRLTKVRCDTCCTELGNGRLRNYS